MAAFIIPSIYFNKVIKLSVNECLFCRIGLVYSNGVNKLKKAPERVSRS